MPPLDSSSILGALATLQSAPPEIFGAKKHDFRLNPRLTEAEVLAFEESHGITLPSDYRQFLTCVGNGGAGPSYGLFPLGHMDDNFDMREWQEPDAVVGVLAEPFLFDGAWNDLTGKPQEDELTDENELDYWSRVDAFYETYYNRKLMNGAIPICDEGCGLRVWLVITGSQNGTLWEDLRSENAGIRPKLLANGSHATFKTWYEEWLDDCVARQKTNGTP